jgi:CHAP domain
MTTLDFVARHLRHRVQSAGGLGGECVDLAVLYLAEVYGSAGPQANAVDWARLKVPGFTWVPNKPTNNPAMGDLVVWAQWDAYSIGPNGHIALALAASPMYLVSCDQNWPTGTPVSLVLHSYPGVAGWHTRTP